MSIAKPARVFGMRFFPGFARSGKNICVDFQRREVSALFDLQNNISARGILTLSKDVAARVLNARNPDAAQVLLWLALHPEETNLNRCAQELALDSPRFSAALALINGAADARQADPMPQEGKPSSQAPVPEAGKQEFVQTLPEYSGEELAQALADEHFAFLCSEAERCLCRPLRRHECSTLLALYEDVGMGCEVLALVLTYIARRTQESSADGASPRISFAQVRNEAMRWHEHGVDTAEKAEEYIKKLDQQQQLHSRVLKILGITARRPSPTELRYIDNFLALDPSLSLIARAYDITVVKKGSLVWPYMRSILVKWHEKGYKTAADVEQGEARHTSGPSAAAASPQAGAQYEEQVLEFLRNNEKV